MMTPLTITPSPALGMGCPVPHFGEFDVLPPHRANRGVAQLAALLLSISRNNEYEGRDPHFIPDNLASGFVADLLGLDVPSLADALLALQECGLVRAKGRVLCLTDLTALEMMSDRGISKAQRW